MERTVVTQRSLQAPGVAAAGVMFGGLAMVVVPQHALTIAQLMVMTAAVAAALHVLFAVVLSETSSGPRDAGPYGRWARLSSPFRRVRLPEEARSEPPEVERTRNYLSGQRLVYATAGLPPLPPEVVRRLARSLRVSFVQRGVDLREPAQQGALSPLSRAVLVAEQEEQSRGKERGRRHRPRYQAADNAQVSSVVHAVLDDIDRLENGGAVSPSAQLTSPRGLR